MAKCKYCGEEKDFVIVICPKCYIKNKKAIERIIRKTVCKLCIVKLEILARPEIEEIEREGVKNE
ncbi:MAG: hypothetical protein QXQ79_02695 [Candidatus Nanoarchaeia archaeon]